MTFSTTTPRMNINCNYAECRYAECHHAESHSAIYSAFREQFRKKIHLDLCFCAEATWISNNFWQGGSCGIIAMGIATAS
jgi:hypothetical protein